jgi:capsid portal protein
MLVSNGQLTAATISRISEFVESQIQGSDNYSKFLIVEAEGAYEGEDAGQVKIDIKPLTKDQHSDELFQQYSKNNQDKIRRSFRLPPILVGRADDYTRATADTSRRLADEQVFAPERDDFDDMINRIIFPAMGIKYHKYHSNSPNTTDNGELVAILGGAERTGGMTPRIARMILEDVLSVELPDCPQSFPQDLPFSMTMAEAVKNMAQPTEPGQQITALKTIDMLTGTDQVFIDRLTAIQKRLDQEWSKATAHEEHD